MDGEYYILGIDVGYSGGFSLINAESNLVFSFAMPIIKDGKNKQIDTKTVYGIMREFRNTIAIKEKVNSFGQGSKSAFSFGKQVGELETLLNVCGIPFYNINPKEWESWHNFPAKQKEQSTYQRRKQLKQYSIKTANEMIGEELIKDDGIADSYLIAQFAYGTLQELIQGEKG